MRAKTINEVNFERNIDPKEAMGTGNETAKIFNKEKILYFLEVTSPANIVSIFGKGYSSSAKAIRAYNSGYYSTFDRNIDRHKQQGYKFRMLKVKIKQNIESVEEI